MEKLAHKVTKISVRKNGKWQTVGEYDPPLDLEDAQKIAETERKRLFPNYPSTD